MNKVCFMMQPFDKGKFDKRYNEIIEPIILECGLVPYRVDKDVASIIPIESIHTKINSSFICIAEITTDNPNVWYELGYALALGKPAIMLCSDERETQFPFDIRHRNILIYQTQTLSDFEKMKCDLKNRINAYISFENPQIINDDLNDYEIAVLKVLWNSQNTPYEITSKDTVFKCNTNNNYVKGAIRNLISKKFIEYTAVYNFLKK